jgi:hypothetical protein
MITNSGGKQRVFKSNDTNEIFKKINHRSIVSSVKIDEDVYNEMKPKPKVKG